MKLMKRMKFEIKCCVFLTTIAFNKLKLRYKQPKTVEEKFLIANISYTMYKKLCMGDLAKMFHISRSRHVHPCHRIYKRAIMFFVHVDVQNLKWRT